ncbi:MAG: CusA/CzcA family heavy metal efflux RND transporter [Bacteroidetes bacterium]|nr:CusA/CzcA family heavy metal efflux RND transporter [Bacteroidota bacterium]
MINKIIDFSLKNRLIILATAMIVLVSGAYVWKSLEIDIFPDLNAPTVVIMTEAHDMAPEELERMVTFPIETAINGSNNLRRLRSSSSMGFSIVWAEFDWDTDIYQARQTINERLATIIETLPQSVEKPILAPQTSLLGEVMIFSLTSDSISEMELRTLADWKFRPRLLSVPGISQVTIIGGDTKEYQILANPDKMEYYGVSLTELVESCDQLNQNSSGSFVDEYSNRYLIRGLVRSNDPVEIGNTVVKFINGASVKISDVAIVAIGAAPAIGKGSYEGKSAVVVTLSKQPKINTLKLTDVLSLTLNELKTELPASVQVNENIFEQANFINNAVKNVQVALFEGAFLVVIILLVFLMNARTTMITIIAIPISLIIAALTLKLMGLTINTMSLGGMAIAIGSIVDDAIIDVENVFKRLKENALKPIEKQKNKLKVVYKASLEIRASILNATFIIIVAFIPLFFLDGMEGRMLRPLGITFIVSLFASLVVALTLTPVLCSLLLTDKRSLSKFQSDNWLVRNLKALYKTTLKKALQFNSLVLALTTVLLIASIILLLSFGKTFLPPFNEGSLTINLATYPGVSLAESDEIGRHAEKILLQIPEIITTSRKTGRAEQAEHSFGVNVSELEVPYLLTDRSKDEFLEEVRHELSGIPGIIVEVGQPITHRIDHMLSGTRSNIAIKLFGQDLQSMYMKAQEIKKAIEDVEGVVDLFVEQQVETPQIKIRPRREMLAKYGVSLQEFNTFVNFAIGGEKISDVFIAEQKFDLVLRYDDVYRNKMEAIKSAKIDVAQGYKVPLMQLADVISGSGPNSISRENIQRKIVISANVAGRDLGSVADDIRSHIEAAVKLPKGYHVEYGGQFESAASAARILYLTTIGAIFIIFLILYQEFKSTKIAGVVLLNLPLAIIGGVFAVWLFSGVISIPSIIGFITLFGIATRNGILLVSRYIALEKSIKDRTTVILEGSLDRLNPILMTALTASLALVPLAFNGDRPGNEIQSPMAIVILGGLLSSTLLNLYVIPLVFHRMLKKHKHEEN